MEIAGYAEVLARIPERPPLLMLDRLEIPGPDEGPGRRIRGLKCVSMDEPCFQGHFPGTPILPGVLQVAAIAQAAGVLLPRSPATAGFLPVLKSLHRIKFRQPVKPGDRLVVEATVEAENADGTITVNGQTLVGGEVTCQGSLVLGLASADMVQPKPTAFAPPLMELAAAEDVKPMTVIDIMKAIPHRYPFLLVDRILYCDLPTFHMVGLKNITGNEPLWRGVPAYGLPACLQVEMAAQVGCTLAFAYPENRGKLGVFMAIDDARFHHPVVPGDQLLIDIVAQLRSRFGKGEARLFVGERLVSEVALKFAVLDAEDV